MASGKTSKSALFTGRFLFAFSFALHARMAFDWNVILDATRRLGVVYRDQCSAESIVAGIRHFWHSQHPHRGFVFVKSGDIKDLAVK